MNPRSRYFTPDIRRRFATGEAGVMVVSPTSAWIQVHDMEVGPPWKRTWLAEATRPTARDSWSLQENEGKPVVWLAGHGVDGAIVPPADLDWRLIKAFEEALVDLDRDPIRVLRFAIHHLQLQLKDLDATRRTGERTPVVVGDTVDARLSRWIIPGRQSVPMGFRAVELLEMPEGPCVVSFSAGPEFRVVVDRDAPLMTLDTDGLTEQVLSFTWRDETIQGLRPSTSRTSELAERISEQVVRTWPHHLSDGASAYLAERAAVATARRDARQASEGVAEDIRNRLLADIGTAESSIAALQQSGRDEVGPGDEPPPSQAPRSSPAGPA